MGVSFLFVVTTLVTSAICAPLRLNDRQAPDTVPDYVLKYGKRFCSLDPYTNLYSYTDTHLLFPSTDPLPPLRRTILPHGSPNLPQQHHAAGSFQRSPQPPATTHSLEPQPARQRCLPDIQRRRDAEPQLDQRHQARRNRENAKRLHYGGDYK